MDGCRDVFVIAACESVVGVGSFPVIPAKAGIHSIGVIPWIPAFAGMTEWVCRRSNMGNYPNLINAFFYFYSTIAQSTAAVFALSTVFIVRKLDFFDRKIDCFKSIQSRAEQSVTRSEGSYPTSSWDDAVVLSELELSDFSRQNPGVVFPKPCDGDQHFSVFIEHKFDDFCNSEIEKLSQNIKDIKKLFDCVSCAWGFIFGFNGS